MAVRLDPWQNIVNVHWREQTSSSSSSSSSSAGVSSAGSSSEAVLPDYVFFCQFCSCGGSIPPENTQCECSTEDDDICWFGNASVGSGDIINSDGSIGSDTGFGDGPDSGKGFDQFQFDEYMNTLGIPGTTVDEYEASILPEGSDSSWSCMSPFGGARNWTPPVTPHL